MEEKTEDKEAIKQAFLKVKEDIFKLNQEVFRVKNEIQDIKNLLNSLINNLSKTPTETSTLQQITPTETRGYPTHSPTNQQIEEALISQNLGISTGNQGVPTDKQTDKPTDRQTDKTNIINENKLTKDRLEVEEILASLNSLKKDLRLKFKRLTKQEFLVFSTLYSLENTDVDYKLLAERLRLSESSIRDYISRIIEKGIPVKKEKLNNKQILLSISPELKKLASLETIMQLRGL